MLELDEAAAIIGGFFISAFGMELGGRTPQLLIYVPESYPQKTQPWVVRLRALLYVEAFRIHAGSYPYSVADEPSSKGVL